jgi:hypothetical protein
MRKEVLGLGSELHMGSVGIRFCPETSAGADHIAQCFFRSGLTSKQYLELESLDVEDMAVSVQSKA